MRLYYWMNFAHWHVYVVKKILCSKIIDYSKYITGKKGKDFLESVTYRFFHIFILNESCATQFKKKFFC